MSRATLKSFTYAFVRRSRHGRGGLERGCIESWRLTTTQRSSDVDTAVNIVGSHADRLCVRFEHQGSFGELCLRLRSTLRLLAAYLRSFCRPRLHCHGSQEQPVRSRRWRWSALRLPIRTNDCLQDDDDIRRLWLRRRGKHRGRSGRKHLGGICNSAIDGECKGPGSLSEYDSAGKFERTVACFTSYLRKRPHLGK